jgi:hypothetical protein
MVNVQRLFVIFCKNCLGKTAARPAFAPYLVFLGAQ